MRPALRADEHGGALDLQKQSLRLHRPDAPVPIADFNFDNVLGPGSTQVCFYSSDRCWQAKHTWERPLALASSLQHDVYNAGVKDVVEDVLQVSGLALISISSLKGMKQPQSALACLAAIISSCFQCCFQSRS